MSAVSEIGRNLERVLRGIHKGELDKCSCHTKCCCTKGDKGVIFRLHPECPEHNSVPQSNAGCPQHMHLQEGVLDD